AEKSRDAQRPQRQPPDWVYFQAGTTKQQLRANVPECAALRCVTFPGNFLVDKCLACGRLPAVPQPERYIAAFITLQPIAAEYAEQGDLSAHRGRLTRPADLVLQFALRGTVSVEARLRGRRNFRCLRR